MDKHGMEPNTRLGRTLKLYLVDGTSSGVITAELGISTVKAAVASRTALPDLIKREEAGRTGVYILVGPNPDIPGGQLAYVGEGDQVRARLIAHDADEAKDFFTRVALIVCKDANLTKAHGRYLESRLIKAIQVAGRAKLVNGTSPEFKGLPEPEIADMERLLLEIDVLLPVLGFDILRSAGQDAVASETRSINAKATQSEIDDEQIFTFTAAGVNAKARETGGEFVVLAGSTARKTEVNSCDELVKRRRAQLIAEKLLVLTDDQDFLRFTKDVPFDTSTGAACVANGGNISGPRNWRHSVTRQTYGEWRAKRLG